MGAARGEGENGVSGWRNYKKQRYRDTLVAQWEKHIILDLRLINLSCMLGVEITLK